MKLKLLNKNIELYKDTGIIVKINRNTQCLKIVSDKELSCKEIMQIMQKYI